MPNVLLFSGGDGDTILHQSYGGGPVRLQRLLIQRFHRVQWR